MIKCGVSVWRIEVEGRDGVGGIYVPKEDC